MKVVKLKPKTNSSAVEILEEALENAISGEYKSISVVFVTKEGNISCDTSDADNNIVMWAALEHAAKHYYEGIIKEQEIER